MMNVGIVGYGIVGEATLRSLGKNKDDRQFRIYDKFKKLDSLETVARVSDYLFVCLPTPVSEAHGADTSIIENCLEDLIPHCKKDAVIIIRSTVPPGTTRRLASRYSQNRFAMMPEFLREATYLEDAGNPDRIVIGADDPVIHEVIEKLYFPIYKPRSTGSTTGVCYFRTSTVNAELLKLSGNAFRSMKVDFANLIKILCDAVGGSYEGKNGVCEMLKADSFVGSNHLDVTDARGFGGKCLPKDLVALIRVYQYLSLDASVLEEIWRHNLRIRKVRDWEKIQWALH